MNKKLQQKIERRNAKFNGASKDEQRKMIILDAISQIKASRFIPKRRNGYCIFDEHELESLFDSKKLDVQQNFLDRKLVTCEVCGIGSLMLSTILFTNNVKLRLDSYGVEQSLNYYDSDSPNKESKQLRKFFPRDELRLIEIAFEGRNPEYYNLDITGSKQYFKDSIAYQFGLIYKDNPTECLLAILNNMLKHGKFKPELT